MFFNYYFDPKSPTFSNGLQSALKAGFEETYALALVSKMPTWLEEKVKEMNMLSKAERNLNNMLDLDEKDSNKLRVKADITKFIAERLGKRKYGSSETQANTFNVSIFAGEQIKRVAGRVLNDDAESERTPDRLLDSDEPQV